MLNYQLAKHLHLFREEGGAGKEARLPVFLWLLTRKNHRSRAWGSVETIASQTGFGKPRVVEALDWLKEMGAIEVVPKSQRKDSELLVRCNVYEMTGIIKVGDQTVPYLYTNEPSGTESEPDDDPDGTESEPDQDHDKPSGSLNGDPSFIKELSQYPDSDHDSIDMTETEPIEPTDRDVLTARLKDLTDKAGQPWTEQDEMTITRWMTDNEPAVIAEWLDYVARNPKLKPAAYVTTMLQKGGLPPKQKKQMTPPASTPQPKYLDAPAPGEGDDDDTILSPGFAKMRARVLAESKGVQ